MMIISYRFMLIVVPFEIDIEKLWYAIEYIHKNI